MPSASEIAALKKIKIILVSHSLQNSPHVHVAHGQRQGTAKPVLFRDHVTYLKKGKFAHFFEFALHREWR